MGKNKEVEETLFSPILPKRTFEEIVTQIKNAIFSGNLKPLEYLPSERRLSELFQASRNTVREAYRVLEESGFIELKSGTGGGARVRELDESVITRSMFYLASVGNISIQEITAARLNLELAALENAFEHLSAENIDMLERELQWSLNLEEMTTEVGYRKELYDFHVKLASISQNQVYIYLVKSLVNTTEQCLATYLPRLKGTKAHHMEHVQIFNTIRERREEEAKMMLKRHLLRMEMSIIKQIGVEDD